MVQIACVCPPKADGQPRHESDEVTLRERLDFRGAVTARNSIAYAYNEDEMSSVPEILARLTETYLIVGISEWTLRDAEGKPVPVSSSAIRSFMAAHPDEAMTVGDAADELYAESVMRPLLAAASTSSSDTPTAPETSPTNGSPSGPPKPSKRSSTTTSQMDGIETTSPLHAGASN